MFKRYMEFLHKFWSYVINWFKELGSKLADALKPGDFNAAIDVINVALLGGIALMLKKFLSGGFKFDLTGGLFDKLGGVLDGLTSHLKTMQASVKADILMKIAIALGISYYISYISAIL